MSTIQACAIYARISRDEDGTALGVARQVKDCTREAERRGWPVAYKFVDNDVSASNGKVRPEYARMIEVLKAGLVNAVIVWDIDRLTRTPTELEEFIALSKAHEFTLASMSGEIDLSTPQGVLIARIKGDVASHEVMQQSRRLKRKYDELAAAGQPHGPIPYGYERVTLTDDRGRPIGRQDVPVPAEAEVIRDWYRRVASGETLRSIAKDANARGLTTRTGKPWVGVTIGRLLRRPLYLGKRTHRGEVVGDGNWEPLIDQDTFDRVTAILGDPSRIPPRGPEPRYLGSGIYQCGRCGGSMRPIVQAKESKNRRQPAYTCPDCNRITRRMAPIDEVVEAVVIARLSAPDAGLDLAPDPTALRDARDARDAILARMDQAADEYAEERITARQLSRITERLKNDLAAAEARMMQHQPLRILDGMTGSGAADAWQQASMEKKRAVLRELVTITILPVGTGVRFAPEHVQFEWKKEA